MVQNGPKNEARSFGSVDALAAEDSAMLQPCIRTKFCVQARLSSLKRNQRLILLQPLSDRPPSSPYRRSFPHLQFCFVSVHDANPCHWLRTYHCLGAKAMKYDTPVFRLDSFSAMSAVMARFIFPILSFGESVTSANIAMRLVVVVPEIDSLEPPPSWIVDK